MNYYCAIDIGASSGRHIIGWVEDGRIQTEEVYRFPNGAVTVDGHMKWDLDNLAFHVFEGLRACKAAGKIPVSVGIDTWGVDYVLLKDGQVCGGGYHYRDARTEGMHEKVCAVMDEQALYERTGIQRQPFNTIYQLMAEEVGQADTLLFMPCYLSYLLCGVAAHEYTIASTSGLLSAATGDWDRELMDRLGLPTYLFKQKPLLPGSILGKFTEAAREAIGFDCTVVLPATHDTGSAYMAVPAKDENSVYLSSGTWSLLGLENPTPITSAAANAAGFTNEGGYGNIRLLKNIMGMWMLQNLRKDENEKDFTAPAVWAQASAIDSIIDVNDKAFLAPACMSDAIRDYCRDKGLTVPQDRNDVARIIYRSLAECYRVAIADLEQLVGRQFTALNIVGGGSQDKYLNALTEEATGLPVTAGPTEGTAIGNLMAQMIAFHEYKNLQHAREGIVL